MHIVEIFSLFVLLATFFLARFRFGLDWTRYHFGKNWSGLKTTLIAFLFLGVWVVSTLCSDLRYFFFFLFDIAFFVVLAIDKKGFGDQSKDPLWKRDYNDWPHEYDELDDF